MKQQLSAFTLMEIMVALSITAVVLSLSFYGFQLLQLQFTQYQKQQDKVAQSRRCLTLLQRDVESCQYLYKVDQQLQLLSQQDTLWYTFLPQLVIRQYGGIHRDSFIANVRCKQAWFEDQKTNDGLIDELTLSIAMTEFVKTLSLQKIYSAEDLIDLDR